MEEALSIIFYLLSGSKEAKLMDVQKSLSNIAERSPMYKIFASLEGNSKLSIYLVKFVDATTVRTIHKNIKFLIRAHV